jgi:hypothetical protein
MINLNDLKNEIADIPAKEPVFIYVGVGTAANTKEHLPLEHYHQFPPFLQDLHNKIPKLHLFLVLIDPLQENPPYVVTDYMLHGNDTHYKSEFIQTFVYRERVYNDPDLNEADLNITPMLRDLNAFAKEKQVSLLYHDFTGRQTALVAEYFDFENKEYLDQIIYGMSAREDHGCFFDLTEPNAYFPYKLVYQENSRPIVKMFNYYKYCVNQTYDKSALELHTYPKEMHALAAEQKQQIIRTIHTQFKTTNLSALRQVRKLLLDEQQAEHIEAEHIEAEHIEAEHIEAEHIEAEQQHMANYIFNDLPKFYREMFKDLFKEKEYDLLYEMVFNYSASELEKLAQLKELALSGEDLLTFITLDEDPYKWYNTMNEMIC